MKQINSKAYNVQEDIIGRITFGRNIFARANNILVSGTIEKPAFGYCATISTKMPKKEIAKPYCVVEDTEHFSEGDIVLINPKGEVIFLYEIASFHNVLMATEKCNHRCIMCPQPPVIQEKDKTSMNLKIISLLDRRTQEIGITGGEPTLIGDNLFLILTKIKERLPKTSISILSNGVKFADKNFALKLAKCHCLDLQIDIPLFSDIADEHNTIVGAKTFYKTVQGLYNLALFHQKIGLRIVVHKKTYKRLPQIADFIYHNFPFVSQVAFMQMEITGLAKENIDSLWIDPYDYNTELREAVLMLADRNMNPYIYNAQLCVLPDDIRNFAVQSISDWKNIYLSDCEGCTLKNQCAGFFQSGIEMRSSHIQKVETNYN